MAEARLPCECKTSGESERLLDRQSTDQSVFLLDVSAGIAERSRVDYAAIDGDACFDSRFAGRCSLR